MVEGTTCDTKRVETQKLADRQELLSVDGQGVLHISLPQQNRRVLRAICPYEWRKETAMKVHGQAHLGFNKTLAQVRMQWFWPGIDQHSTPTNSQLYALSVS